MSMELAYVADTIESLSPEYGYDDAADRAARMVREDSRVARAACAYELAGLRQETGAPERLRLRRAVRDALAKDRASR